MSDALEPCSGCSTYTVFSYTLFSWSLNTVQVVRRAFLAPVPTGASRDLQTDRSFPSAHSSYNQTFSAPPAFGHISVRAWAPKPGRAPHPGPCPEQVRWGGQAVLSHNQACGAHGSVQITVWMCPGQLLQATCLFSMANKRLQYKYKLLKAIFLLTNEWVTSSSRGRDVST